MRLAFLSVLLIPILAAPAQAGSGAVVRGDPVIDAQWAAQLRFPPAVDYIPPPIDLTGRAPNVVRGRVRAPDAVIRHAPPPVAVVTSPRTIDGAYLPALIVYPTPEKPGTIIIDPRQRYLYYVLGNGKAQRYGVGVGRDGFGWSGTVTVGRKAEWPTWTPPAEMRKRQPYLPASMKGGPNNPLGARAIYLYRNGRDTLYRIHGSNEPWTIGRAVSSGCFRMRNEDVIELFRRVKVGTKVVVL